MRRRFLCSEADVQKAVTDLLELDGWRSLRTDPVTDASRGKAFGEFGMPDYLYIRYDLRAYEPTGPRDVYAVIEPPAAAVLWIEFKAKGETPKVHQRVWHEAEQARGAMVLVVDDIDDFIRWYSTSGLCRRMASFVARAESAT